MNPIETLRNEYDAVIQFLDDQMQPSLSSDIKKHFKKIIALSAASYFEDQIKVILVKSLELSTNYNIPLVSFVKNKAIHRQYHTYFNWSSSNGNKEKAGNNANAFLSLFGDQFKVEIERKIKSSLEMQLAMTSFIEIGHLRNLLIHNNFASYDLDSKSADEVYTLFEKGQCFVDFIANELNVVASSKK